MSKLADQIISQYQIAPESALGKLVALTCQRTRFFGEDSARFGWESTKALRRFRDLLPEAVSVGVTDKHIREAGPMSPEITPATPSFRPLCVAVLQQAINRAKAAKFRPVREQDYSLHEMRRIAAKSGSRFFANLDKGSRVNSLKGNIVYVRKNNCAEKRWYQMDCKTGTFSPITRLSDSNSLTNTVNSATTIETENV